MGRTTGVRHAASTLFDWIVGSVAVIVFGALVAPVSRVRRLVRRRRGLGPRIVWGPIPIINVHYSVQADRLYGYASEALVFRVYAINQRDQFDRVLDGGIARVPVVRRLVPYWAFLQSGIRYDIFGFFFDGGFLYATPFWRAELALLRLAGKRIIVYPYGSDARLASVTRSRGGWNAYSDIAPGKEDRNEDQVRRRLAAFGRHADVILGCADLYDDLPRVDGMLRYPFDAAGWEAAAAPPSQSLRIAHAPNHRHYKGTRFLIDAVRQLRAEGIAVELDLVEGMPTEQARDVYRRADIVADQFLIGAYALLAIEGMALGKPVVCYLADRFRAAHPEWDECPIVSATPDDLVARLRCLLADSSARREIGQRGPGFVQRHHSLERVGADMDAIYRRLWP